MTAARHGNRVAPTVGAPAVRRLAAAGLWLLAVTLMVVWAAVTAYQVYVAWHGWLE